MSARLRGGGAAAVINPSTLVSFCEAIPGDIMRSMTWVAVEIFEHGLIVSVSFTENSILINTLR
jgi:hypothetical protein